MRAKITVTVEDDIYAIDKHLLKVYVTEILSKMEFTAVVVEVEIFEGDEDE